MGIRCGGAVRFAHRESNRARLHRSESPAGLESLCDLGIFNRGTKPAPQQSRGVQRARRPAFDRAQPLHERVMALLTAISWGLRHGARRGWIAVAWALLVLHSS